MSHAFLVLQDIMAEGWILKIAQDWSAFAVSEVKSAFANTMHRVSKSSKL